MIIVMNVIEIKNLSKHFGKTKAVNGISFSVEKGEVFGFLGPNGAGKTTTIRCLMDFLRPTDGSITILGQDAKKDSVKLKQKIGFISGDVRLYQKWTAKEHFALFESLKGKSKILAKLIKDLNLDQNQKIKNLSTGNKQKVAIILALMHEPEVLILDEPTVGLDPLLQNRIYEILADFKKKGTTIFISSHNLAEVQKICNRVAIIKEGKLLAVESVENMEQKSLKKIEVRFRKPVKAADFKDKNIQSISQIPDGFLISVSGDINPVLAKLTKHEIKDIEINHATLEDIFLEFYE